MAVLLARFRLEAAFMPTRRSRPAVAVRLLWALLTRPLSMLGLPQLYVLTSLSTTQTRALAASSLMLRRVRLDSRLVHRVRANTKSKPLMALSEFVARSVAVLYLRAGGRRADRSFPIRSHSFCGADPQ